MITDTLFLFAAPVLAALLTAAVALAIGAALRWPQRQFQCLMLLLAVASVARVLLSGRRLYLGDQTLAVAAAEQEAASNPVAKLLLALVVLHACVLCAISMHAWLAHGRRLPATGRHEPDTKALQPQKLALAFTGFFIAFSVLPIRLGAHPYFHVSLVYPLVVFLAIFFWTPAAGGKLVQSCRQCLNVIVLGSLVAAVLLPGLALEPGYTGFLPGITWRLWGVTATANSLGAAASALLVLECMQCSSGHVLRWLVPGGTALALLLSQSKTALIASLVAIAIIVAWRSGSRLRSALIDGRRRGVLTAGGLLSAVLVPGLMIMWLLLQRSSMDHLLAWLLESNSAGDLSTATGRTWIWQAALQAGWASPWFGQGGDFWEFENRVRLGLTGAAHAHNLFLQVFSRAGFVGLLGLLPLLGLLLLASWRAAPATRGGSLALAAMFLVRAMTEVPLQPNGILSAEIFSFLLWLCVLMAAPARMPRLLSAQFPGHAGIHPKALYARRTHRSAFR